MQKADSLQKAGLDEQAVVLYMIVAARSEKNASDGELAMHVKANLNIGNIYYDKGNYTDEGVSKNTASFSLLLVY